MPSKGLIVEYFDDGAIVLKLACQLVFRLNQVEGILFNHLASLSPQTKEALSVEHEKNISLAIQQLLADELIQLKNTDEDTRKKNMNEVLMYGKYTKNPDVIIREEEEEGCLLFNPDTNQVQLLNETAAHIWCYADGIRDVSSIVDTVIQTFEGASKEEVEADVKAFIITMQSNGFLGKVV